MREAARKANLDVGVGSVGTAAYHVGEHPDQRAINTASQHDVDISDAVGRQLAERDFLEATHIFALDKANLAGIRARAPRHGTAHIAMLMDAVEGREGESIPDPYYGDEAGFEECWQTISTACDALVAAFIRDGVEARF